jgi:hypothetical protein
LCLACLTAPAFAVPVNWDLSGSIARTNAPWLGAIGIGDAFSASMVVETDTPPEFVAFASSQSFVNVFDSFTLNIGGKTLNLGADSSDHSYAIQANDISSLTFDDYQAVQMHAIVFDADTPYFVDLRFEFTDTTTFPYGSLPSVPPSLATARLADFAVYSPVDGNPLNGAIFIAGGPISSFTARGVPEPSMLWLGLGAFAMLGVFGRRRGAPLLPA